MAIYIITILISLLFIFCADRVRNNKSLFLLFSWISIIPSLIIAGFRDYSVGTDVWSYIVPNFTLSRVFESFQDYNSFLPFSRYSLSSLGMFVNGNTEFGYNLLVFIISRVTDDPHWLLFTIQFIISSVLLISNIKISNRFNTPLFPMYFVFYTTYWLMSMNIMRQYCAVSMNVLALVYLIEKKYGRYLLLQILAISFHQTALVGIVFAIMYILMQRASKNKIRLKNSSTFITASMIFLISFTLGNKILYILEIVISKIPIINNHMYSFFGVTGTSFFRTMMYVAPILVFFIIYDLAITDKYSIYQVEQNEEELVLLRWVKWIGYLGIGMDGLYHFQDVIPRFAQYSHIILIVLLGILIKRLPTKKLLFASILLMLFGIYEFSYFKYTGNGDVYPYVSSLLSLQ